MFRINGEFVHSQLHCDPGRGWTDFEGNWFSESHNYVTLTCENGESAFSPFFYLQDSVKVNL